METQKKKTIIIMASVVTFLTVGYLANKYLHPPKKVETISIFIKDDPIQTKANENQSDEKVDVFDENAVKEKLGLQTSETSSPAESQTNDSQPEPSVSESSIARLENSLNNYFTIELSKEKIDNRSTVLKTELSPELYTNLNIQSNSETLKIMLVNWEEKKQLDTNQPIQLMSQAVEDLTIYSDTKTLQEVNHLAVKASLILTSPLSKVSSKVVRWYEVKQSGGLIKSITLVDEKGD